MDSESSCSSPVKQMRKRTTPTRYRDNVEITDLTSPSGRRRRRSSGSNNKASSVAVYGVVLLFLLSSLAFVATRQGLLSSSSTGNLRFQLRTGGPGGRRLGLQPQTPKLLGDGPIREFTLSDSTRDELYQELINLKVDTANLQDLESFIDTAKEVVQSHVGQVVLEALQDIHNASSPYSALLFHNLPTDPHVPTTPTDGSLSLGKSTYIAEALLVGLGELTNSHTVGYSAETAYSNPWIHEGFPRTSAGSALTKASELSFHQDMSYHPKPPDVLGLVCLREGHDKDVKTELVDNREVLDLLPTYMVDRLQESRFQIKTSGWVDASWAERSKQGRPMLQQNELAIPVDWENMVGLDAEAQEAVQLLSRAIDEAPRHYVHFTPGMLLLFNNRRVIHARTPYKDLRYDGGDRVMYRTYLRKEMAAAERTARML